MNSAVTPRPNYKESRKQSQNIPSSAMLRAHQVAGILFTTNFGLANYSSSDRVTLARHILNHLTSALGGMDTIPLVVLAGIGFVIGSRRRSLAVNREGVRP